MLSRSLAAIVVLAACGVRNPPPLDVDQLVATEGADEARQELEIRIIEHPRDVQARLAIAALDDRGGRPGEALGELEEVEQQGGLFGPRWHDADRARFARLLAARGRARLARGSSVALGDLVRAAALGAAIRPEEVTRARADAALAKLRHVDPDLRADGRAELARLGALPGAEPVWRGAAPKASPAERAAFGIWLWSLDARREAYEQLAAWHDATPAPRDPSTEAAYQRALAWWTPPDLVAAGSGGTVAPAPTVVIGSTLAPLTPAAARVGAVVHYVARRSGVTDAATFESIARAYDRDPAIAARLGRDFVARSIDTATAHAAVGAAFEALGDPATARAEWQAAADGDPAYAAPLAEAIARAGDGDAALVAMAAGAAWSGDPAPVLALVARALLDANRPIHALTAARSAIDLAGPDAIAPALDVAIAASRAVHRDAQADELAAERRRVAPPPNGANTSAASAALESLAHDPNGAALANAWVVATANPRDAALRAALIRALPAGDPRRPTLYADLADLAGDSDPERAFIAARAVRH